MSTLIALMVLLMLSGGAFALWRWQSRPATTAPAGLAPSATGTRAAASRTVPPRSTSNSRPSRTLPPVQPEAEPAEKPRVRFLKSVDLAPIEWEFSASPVPAEGPITLTSPIATAAPPDPLAARIRDRYLAARFPGAIRTAADLADASGVVRAARLYFEDGLMARAAEILDLAIESHPEADSTWLAALEIAFLARDADRYVALAHAFHREHTDSPDWTEVVRLGRRLAPMHPRFAGAPGAPRDFDHFGPWPHLPNWIQANWDLTGEVDGVELRARLMATAPAGLAPLSAVA